MNLVARAYLALRKRKAALFTLTAALVGVCMLPLIDRPLAMDIRVMLPEGPGKSITRDMGLLERSPLASSVFVVLRSNAHDPELLARAADAYTGALDGGDLRVMDTGSVDFAGALRLLVEHAPQLMEEKDFALLEARLKPEALRSGLGKARAELISFQGMAVKDVILADPLLLRELLAGRYAQFGSLQQGRMSGGYLEGRDGKSLLLAARTQIPLTDSEGSARIMAQVEAAALTLPPGVSADLVSGHAQAVANAQLLRADLALIGVVTPAFFAVLFFTFIRRVRALALYLTPLAALVAAAGAAAYCGSSVSGVVLAFGGVLLGIAEDYGMYVYFALANQPERPAEALAEISRPMLATAATTCAGFAVFLWSDTPGQRQLAVYFLSGLAMSTVFSLFVLPHVFGRLPAIAPPAPRRQERWRAILGAGLCVTVLCACAAGFGGLRFDGDLRNLGVTPPKLRQAEARLTEDFGDVRRRAVVFVSDANEENVLRNNELLWRELRRELPEVRAVSLAPLLPSAQTQRERAQRWREFWNEDRTRAVQTALTREAAALGFSPRAFTSAATIASDNPALLDFHAASAYGLSGPLSFLRQNGPGGTVSYLTVVPDSEEVRSFFTPEREARLGARLVSTTNLRHSLESTMRSELLMFLGSSILAVGCVLAALCRNARRWLAAAVPPLSGLAAVIGWLGLSATPLNIFHVAAFPLVIGMGVGFGIFQISGGRILMPLATDKAMLATGLSTLGGFGALALAKHPALHSMGLTVLVGVGVALAAALLASRWLAGKRE